MDYDIENFDFNSIATDQCEVVRHYRRDHEDLYNTNYTGYFEFTESWNKLSKERFDRLAIEAHQCFESSLKIQQELFNHSTSKNNFFQIISEIRSIDVDDLQVEASEDYSFEFRTNKNGKSIRVDFYPGLLDDDNSNDEFGVSVFQGKLISEYHFTSLNELSKHLSAIA